MTEVWLCGRWVNDEIGPLINGIFSTEAKAKGRCRDPHDYIAPFNLDEELPVDPVEMVGHYYPLNEGDY